MTQATRPASITCVQCGEEKSIGKRGPLPTYCSANCRAAAKYQRSRQDGRYEQELAAARQRTQERRQANARSCPYCEAPMLNPRSVQCGEPECKRAFKAAWMREWQRSFKAATGDWYHSKYEEQQRQYNRRRHLERPHWRVTYPDRAALADARRRMRMQQARTAEVFAPLDVHTRDQWTCQLCLLPIDPDDAWPSRMSASVDHIIPLSRGGAHSMINVQSAHLGCNTSKGDRLTVKRIKL